MRTRVSRAAGLAPLYFGGSQGTSSYRAYAAPQAPHAKQSQNHYWWRFERASPVVRWTLIQSAISPAAVRTPD